MRIEQLRIENFRRFAHVDIELPDGVLTLVGRNGAGKSTLLEAIGWCLYGHDAARTGKDLIKRRGAAPGDAVRVHLAFRLGAHAYEITRELLGKNGSHVATVLVDGKVVVPAGAQSHRETSEYVARLFHMDRDAFFTSLVARQRELAALTDASPSARKRLLIGLLRLDAVDTAIQTARQRKREARSELTGLRSATQEMAPLNARLVEVRKLLGEDREKLSANEHAITQLVEQVEDLKSRRAASRKAADADHAIATEVASADQTLRHVAHERKVRHDELNACRKAATEAGQLAPRLAGLDEARATLERLGALRVQHEELQRLHQDAKKTQADLEKARADAERAASALAAAGAVRSLSERVQRERPRQEKMLEDWQRQAVEASARITEAQRSLRELEAKAKRIREMGPESPCPTCTRPLREHHDELLHGFDDDMRSLRTRLDDDQPKLEEARRQEAAVRESLQGLAQREQELRTKIANLAREEERQAGARARVEEAEARLARLREQEAALGAEPFDAAAHEEARRKVRELEALREKHAGFRAQAERENDVRRIMEELAETERAATAQKADAQRRRQQLAFDAKAHAVLEQQTEDAEAKLSQARVLRERLTGEHQRRLDEEKRLVADIARAEELAKRAEALEKDMRLLEQLAGDRDHGLLPEFKNHLIGRVRPLLSLHAGRLFRELTDSRYQDLEVDEDYDLLVHEDGEAYALERFSGGEGDLANLCLRLAVSQVVAERAGTEGFGFLALDEVFGSQDEVRKGNILRALRGLSARFRQILVITHVQDVKDAADHVLRVEAMEDGTSRVELEG